MAEDVTITFEVEDSSAMAKLGELQAKLGTIDQSAVALGQKITDAFRGMGISLERGFKLAGPEDRAAIEAYLNSLTQVTGATNELSEETQKAGINIENMMTRMVTRMAVFEAVRLGMKMLSDEFKEVTGFEAGRVAFENMTIGAKDATEAEKILDQVTRETGIDHEKLYSAVISLENAGEGPKAAAQEVENLGKFAAATHGDIDKMSKALSDIRLGTASVQEMFDLAHRTGEAKDEMVGLVTEYANLTREIQRADHARAQELATMREEVAEQEKLIDEQIRSAEIAAKAAEKQIADRQKLVGLQESFLSKMLEAEGKPPGHADPALARAMQPGGLPQTEAGKQMTADIAAGFQRIYDEENLTTQGMQHFVDTGQIGLREILEAAKRLHAAEKEARDEALAKTKEEAEAKKRGLQEGPSELAKEDTVAKKAEKVELDKKRLELADKFSTAINDQANAEKIYADWAATAEGKMALAAAHAKEIREQSEQAALATKTIADAWGALQPPGSARQAGWWTFPTPGGNVMVGKEREAVLGAGKVSVKDENSDESVRLLRGIQEHLSGQGTP